MLYSERQPRAAPPLPSQPIVHFLDCSTDFWLIVESLCLSDPVYPCCCIVCDLPSSCQEVIFVSPSPPVGGTPCRIQTSVRLTSLKLFRSTYKPTTLKPISRIVHLKNNNLCGAPNSPEHPPSLSQRQLPL